MISDLEKVAESASSFKIRHLIIISFSMIIVGWYGAQYYSNFIDKTSAVKQLNDDLSLCNQAKDAANYKFGVISTTQEKTEIARASCVDSNKNLNDKVKGLESQIANFPACPTADPQICEPATRNATKPYVSGEIGADLAKASQIRIGKSRNILGGKYVFTAYSYDYGLFNGADGCRLQIKRPRNEYQNLNFEKNQTFTINLEDIKLEIRFNYRYENGPDKLCDFTMLVVIN